MSNTIQIYHITCDTCDYETGVFTRQVYLRRYERHTQVTGCPGDLQLSQTLVNQEDLVEIYGDEEVAERMFKHGLIHREGEKSP